MYVEVIQHAALLSYLFITLYYLFSGTQRSRTPAEDGPTAFEAAPETLSGLRSIVHPRGVEPRIAGYKPVATNRITLGA